MRVTKMGVDNNAILFFGFKEPQFIDLPEDEDEDEELEKLCEYTQKKMVVGMNIKMSMGDGQYYLVSAVFYRTPSYDEITLELPKMTETEMTAQIKQYCEKHGIVFQSPQWYLVAETC